MSQRPKLKACRADNDSPKGSLFTILPKSQQTHPQQGEETSQKRRKTGRSFIKPKKSKASPRDPVDQRWFVEVANIAQSWHIPGMFTKFQEF